MWGLTLHLVDFYECPGISEILRILEMSEYFEVLVRIEIEGSQFRNPSPDAASAPHWGMSSLSLKDDSSAIRVAISSREGVRL